MFFEYGLCVDGTYILNSLPMSRTDNNQGSESGIVRCSLLEYTENFGPQYYIGGIDVHKGINWAVHNNTFKNIRSPEVNGRLAEFAVHFWSYSENLLIEKNIIIRCGLRTKTWEFTRYWS